MADEFKHKAVGTSLSEQEWTGVDTHQLDQQATGDLIYALSPTQLSRLGIGSTGQLLGISGGVPAWETYAGTTDIGTVGTIGTGVWEGTEIGATFGGTGQTSWSTGDMLYASGTNTLAKLGIGTTDQQLRVTALGAIEWFTPASSGTPIGLAVALALVL